VTALKLLGRMVSFLHFTRMLGIIGTEELRPVNEFIRNEKLPKGINTSHVTLIPKCKSPNSFADYKPISMIHGLYKIVAKLFSARLKQTIYAHYYHFESDGIHYW